MKPPANVYEEFSIFSQTLQMTFVLISPMFIQLCARELAVYLEKKLNTKDTKGTKVGSSFEFSPALAPEASVMTFVFKKDFNMTLQDQYKKWQENTLKKSLDRFSERKNKFETTAGIEIPRVAMPDGSIRRLRRSLDQR